MELLSRRPSRVTSRSCLTAVDRAYLEHARKDFDLKQLIKRKKEELCCDRWHFPGFLLALPRAGSVVKSAGNHVFLILQKMFALIVTFLRLKNCCWGWLEKNAFLGVPVATAGWHRLVNILLTAVDILCFTLILVQYFQRSS